MSQRNTKPSPLAEHAEVTSTWGLLIDRSMQEVDSSLLGLQFPPDQEGDKSREAWKLVSRAFHSSAVALRALAR